MTLPQWPGSQLDIGKLSRIFDTTTTTYKYWFFLSLLDLIVWNNTSQGCPGGKETQDHDSHALAILTGTTATAKEDLIKINAHQAQSMFGQKANPLDIPLTLVLWHMLELSFQAVNEFHVHFPFFDRIPLLVSQVQSVLQLKEQSLTITNLQHSLARLGRAIFRDQCTNNRPISQSNSSPNNRPNGWPVNFLDLPNAVLTRPSVWEHNLTKAQGDENDSGGSPIQANHAADPEIPDYAKFLKDFGDLEKYVIYRLLSPWIGSQDALARFSAKDKPQDGHMLYAQTHQVCPNDLLTGESAFGSALNQSLQPALHSAMNSSLAEDELVLPYKIGQVRVCELDERWQPNALLVPVNTMSSAALALLEDDWGKVVINPQKKIKVVRLNPQWVPYLQKHKEILQAFTYQNLASKLEVLNPLMPALLAKLLPQNKREALTAQRAYFSAFLQHQQLTSIYTGQSVSLQDDFALDHFLPWSFVHHDLIWNLTPISRELNSSKSNQLPDPALISRLSDQQLELLRFHVCQGQNELKTKAKVPEGMEDNFLGSKFNAFISDFLELGQGRSIYALSHCSPKEFYTLLAAQLEPAIKIAQNQGFTSWQM